MNKSDRIFVAGHRGMVGSAVLRRLEAEGFGNIVMRARAQLDLTDESAVAKFFAKEKPDLVCRLLLEKKKPPRRASSGSGQSRRWWTRASTRQCCHYERRSRGHSSRPLA